MMYMGGGGGNIMMYMSTVGGAQYGRGKSSVILVPHGTEHPHMYHESPTVLKLSPHVS